jgi:predicted Holliday junction resolvase-like endonuclease
MDYSDFESIESAIKIACIIQVVVLIVFFYMAYNVSLIKKHLLKSRKTEREYMKMAEIEKYVGSKDKAKEYLLRAKYILEEKIQYVSASENEDDMKTKQLCLDEVNKINDKLNEL